MVKIVVRDADDEVPAGSVFLSQDEARRRLGEDHIDIRPISGTLQDIADSTPAVLGTDGRWSPALVEGLIAAVDDFEGPPRHGRLLEGGRAARSQRMAPGHSAAVRHPEERPRARR